MPLSTEHILLRATPSNGVRLSHNILETQMNTFYGKVFSKGFGSAVHVIKWEYNNNISKDIKPASFLILYQWVRASLILKKITFQNFDPYYHYTFLYGCLLV